MEISSETRLLLIELAEGFAEGLRQGTMQLSERNAKAMERWAKRLLNTEEDHTPERPCNTEMVCRYLGISRPTLKKYIAQGLIPEGRKYSGFTERVWDKRDIEAFDKERMKQKEKKL